MPINGNKLNLPSQTKWYSQKDPFFHNEMIWYDDNYIYIIMSSNFRLVIEVVVVDESDSLNEFVFCSFANQIERVHWCLAVNMHCCSCYKSFCATRPLLSRAKHPVALIELLLNIMNEHVNYFLKSISRNVNIIVKSWQVSPWLHNNQISARAQSIEQQVSATTILLFATQNN